jgi:hypothetical protein
VPWPLDARLHLLAPAPVQGPAVPAPESEIRRAHHRIMPDLRVMRVLVASCSPFPHLARLNSHCCGGAPKISISISWSSRGAQPNSHGAPVIAEGPLVNGCPRDERCGIKKVRTLRRSASRTERYCYCCCYSTAEIPWSNERAKPGSMKRRRKGLVAPVCA